MDIRQMSAWVDGLMGTDDIFSRMEFSDYAKSIPRVDSLDLPVGTPVLVRCDLDVKIKDGKAREDVRLRSSLETLNHCMCNGWKTIVFGHIGRDPELTLKPVAEKLSEMIGKNVIFLENWTDGKRINHATIEAVKKAKNGDVLMLENTREHAIERALWKQECDPKIQQTLLTMASGFRNLSKVFINEAIASSNRDVSSCIVPFAMDKVALGFFYYKELEQHMTKARDADVVVFSGTKMDKLDDLVGVVRRGKVRCVVTAGALAMALKKAHCRLNGNDFCIGLAETNEDEKYYISEDMIAKAADILNIGTARGMKFVLPEDFVLDDGTVAEFIPKTGSQFDIGPKTKETISRELDGFISSNCTIFHNGVLGKFEDPRFEAGTKWFMTKLKEAKEKGAKVYVGGGEGAEALEKYGSNEWVDHAFTCGGTVLTAMTDQPIPPLKALAMKCDFRT